MEARYDNVNVDDKLLIEGCKKSERRYQELLYRKYAREMYHIALSYAGDKEEASDILQEAFLKVFRNVEDFRDKGSLKAWIRRIVSNTALDYYRSRKRLGFTQAVDESYDIPAAEENDVEIKHGAEEVFSMIRQLPEGARIIFQLFAVEGYSHKEIADKMNISESTSKSQYQRARSLLIKMLNKREAS